LISGRIGVRSVAVVFICAAVLLPVAGGQAEGGCQFIRAFGSGDTTLCHFLRPVADSNMVMTGYVTGARAGGRDVLIAKADACGHQVWAKAFGGSGDELGRCIIEASDGGLVLCGYTTSVYGSGPNLHLSKFSSSGQWLWTKVHYSSLGVLGFRGCTVIEDSGGNLVVTGCMHRQDLNRYSLYLAKFNSSGDHIDTRSYYHATTAHCYGHTLAEACDGDYVVVGRRQTLTLQEDVLLAKFAPSLQCRWGWQINDPGNGDRENVWTLIRTPDCGFALAGMTGDDLFLLRRDAALDPVWGWTLTTGNTEYPKVRVGAVQTSDGGFVVAGGRTSRSGDVILAKCNASGTRDWVRGLGTSTEKEVAYTVAEDAGQNLWVGGHTYSWGDGDPSLLLSKHDSDGVTCADYSLASQLSPWSPAEGAYTLLTWFPTVEVGGWTPTVSAIQLSDTTICTTEALKRFVRGDTDASGEINISDPIYNLCYQYATCDPPPCMDAADCDDSGEININDPIYNLEYQFAGGPLPPAPFPGCDEDPTALDVLDCLSFPPCEGGPRGTASQHQERLPAERWLVLESVPESERSTLTVDITLRARCPVMGFEFTAGYDPSGLEFVGLDRAGFAGEGFDFFSCNADEECGRLRVGALPDMTLTDPVKPGIQKIGCLRFRVTDSDVGMGSVVELLGGMLVCADRQQVGLERQAERILAESPVAATGITTGTTNLSIPSPFQPHSRFLLTLSRGLDVRIDIYDVQGRLVRTLANGWMNRGEYELGWDGRAGAGHSVAPGIFYVHARLGEESRSGSMLYVR
jgi:hypothetical protein